MRERIQIKVCECSCKECDHWFLYLGSYGMGQVGVAASVTSVHRELQGGHVLHLVKVLLRRSQQPAPPVA